MNAIECTNVVKQFEGVRAVDGLNLTVPEGTLLGLLGRNGAGKSTTLKMVTGLLRPTHGTVQVLGLDVVKHPLEVKQRVGSMPEEMSLLDMLTAHQYLRFVGRMYGMAETTIDARMAELFDRLELAPAPRLLIADFSFGMKKKVALCAALIHAPQLIVLDEPFEGIDAVTSRTIKDIILSLSAHGVTVVLTTHVLEVVEKLCPTVAIIDAGRLKAHGPTTELAKDGSLEARFVELVGGYRTGDLSWL